MRSALRRSARSRARSGLRRGLRGCRARRNTNRRRRHERSGGRRGLRRDAGELELELQPRFEIVVRVAEQLEIDLATVDEEEGRALEPELLRLLLVFVDALRRLGRDEISLE